MGAATLLGESYIHLSFVLATLMADRKWASQEVGLTGGQEATEAAYGFLCGRTNVGKKELKVASEDLAAQFSLFSLTCLFL